jgi:hypothetical protein
MSEDKATLSVTVVGDHDVTEELLAQLEPYRKGEVERTRDFGVTIALATSIVALAKTIVDLWQGLRPASHPAPSGAPRAAVTIEARDGAVLSLPDVRNKEEIERFIAEHAQSAH